MTRTAILLTTIIEETRKRLKDLIDKAVAYIIEKNNGKYEIQNDISYDF